MNESLNRITRFERTRLISARALQLSLGAPLLIKAKAATPYELAKEEFETGVLPLSVVRTMPNGERKVINITG